MEKPNNQEKLGSFEARYRELAKIPFKSDEEIKELEQLEREIEFLKDTIADTKIKAEHLVQVKTIEKIEKVELKKPKKKRKDKNYIDETLLDPLTKDKLYQLRKKHNIANAKLKIFNMEQDLEKKEERLDEIDREKEYVTKKPDKDGLIELDQDKYEEKMGELKDRLSAETDFWAKEKIKGQISNLKMAKVQVKVNNASIKMSRGVKKFSNAVNEIGKHLESFSQFSGYQEQEKKGKKGSSDNNDYGFNPNDVFKL